MPEATMVTLPGDPPYRRPDYSPSRADVIEARNIARAMVAHSPKSPTLCPVPPDQRVVRTERIVRPDGDLYLHWWGDGRLSVAFSSRSSYQQIFLRHADSLALLAFMTGEDMPDTSDTLLDRVREAGVEGIGL